MITAMAPKPKSKRTWCRVDDGIRVPAAGVMFWRRDPEGGRLQLATLLFAGRRGLPPKMDMFGGKCEKSDFGIEGTMTREFAEEMYYTREVSCAMLRLHLQGARRVMPGGNVLPAPGKAPGEACELVLLPHKDSGAYSFACLIAPCPKKLTLPSAGEYAAARARALNSTVPAADYCGEIGAEWVDYATFAANAGLPGAPPLEHRMHLVLDQQRLLDELAESDALCYSKQYAAAAAKAEAAKSAAKVAAAKTSAALLLSVGSADAAGAGVVGAAGAVGAAGVAGAAGAAGSRAEANGDAPAEDRVYAARLAPVHVKSASAPAIKLRKTKSTKTAKNTKKAEAKYKKSRRKLLRSVNEQ